MTATSQPMTIAEHEAAPAVRPPERMRASDGERQDVVDQLHHALGEGRLDLAEADTRVAVAYAARFRDEFPALLVDLPMHDAAGEVPGWGGIWAFVVWRIRMVLWGLDERGRTRPSAAQCRTAAWIAVAMVVWLGVCCVLGAALVAG